MKPLNPADCIWLAGTGDEINQFLKSEEVSQRSIFLGHPDDSDKFLARHITDSDLGRALMRFVGRKPEICFLLLEGKVVGLIKTQEVTATA